MRHILVTVLYLAHVYYNFKCAFVLQATDPSKLCQETDFYFSIGVGDLFGGVSSDPVWFTGLGQMHCIMLV